MGFRVCDFCDETRASQDFSSNLCKDCEVVWRVKLAVNRVKLDNIDSRAARLSYLRSVGKQLRPMERVELAVLELFDAEGIK